MDNANTKQKLIVQIVCLLLSIGLWFYVTNIENPILINDINKVPVEIVNSDILREYNLALTPDQEFYVNLKIEGLSQDLRKVKRDDFEIKVDLNGYAFKKGQNRIPVTIVDYPTKVNIKNSNSLAVNINIEEYVVKEMPIKSNVEIIAKPNYYIAPVVFKPSVVKVSGPSSLVERVDAVVADGQEVNVSETIFKNYNIEAKDIDGNIVNGIELSTRTAEATIKINQGRIVPIKLKTIGDLKEGIKLTSLDLVQKEIEISGPQEILDTINELSTEPIDLSTITDNSTVEVNLVIPDGIMINSSSKKVSVNIKVEKITSKEFTVAFTIIGVEEGLNVTSTSETIKVKVTGYEEEISKINDNNIKVELNVSQHKEAGTFSETPSVEFVGINTSATVEPLEKITYELILEEQTE